MADSLGLYLWPAQTSVPPFAAVRHGTRRLRRITGRLDFKDDVTTAIATYRGHIKLPKAPQTAVAVSFGATSANAAPISSAGC